MKKTMKQSFTFLGFASPWLLGFTLVLLIPIVMSLVISFTKWDILTSPSWVGLDNYIEIFHDELFFKSLKVTLSYAFFSVPLQIVLSIFVAMLLNAGVKFINLFRTIFYLPVAVSSTAAALLWAWVFHPEFGLINNLLYKIGINGPRWIYDEKWVMISLIIMSLWSIGGGIIIYLSGLQSIPTELYEVAKMDGAGWFSRFIHITIPSMSPILLFTTLTGIIAALQTFTQAYVMTAGGPNNASMFYAYYIYNHAFVWHKMGVASALAWILFIIIFIISLVVLKVSKNRVYYESKEDVGVI